MKIKEVIEKTGLTDRAIRLYIDEGLAAPSIEESYSGRKSIEFSDGDVERLNNVAMLRKAGFSIADIKIIVDDKAMAKEVVEKFIEQTKDKIEHETEIVEKLKGIPFDEDVTLETICDSLVKTVEEKRVPSEDLYYRQTKKFAKRLSVSIILAAMLIFGISMIYLNSQYEHLFFDEGSLLLVLLSFSGWILLSISAVIILATYAVHTKTANGKKTQDKITNIAAFVIWVFFVPSILVSVIGTAIIVPVAIHSQTSDPKDYLELDSVVETEFGDEIQALFPDEIPAFSDNDLPVDVKYFYSCEYGFDFGEKFDLIAEWSLSKRNYEKAKSDVPESINGIEAVTKQKGNWVCVYYADSNEEHTSGQGGYTFLNFAYNDELQKVRYIASSDCCSYPEETEVYLSLDW